MKFIKEYNTWSGLSNSDKTGIEITVNGSDFIVDGFYDGGESPVMYYNDGTGYPGNVSGFEISKLIGFNDNGDEFVIWDNEELEKITDKKEKNDYNNDVDEYLKDEYGVTFDDISISVIEEIEY